MTDRLITVAIHTYNRANALKALLESEGVSVSLQNVNLDHPVVSSGVRVRIRECDLPMALRIIENKEIFADPTEKIGRNKKQYVIVPVDFSKHSQRACSLAFHLASMYHAEILLLHTYINPVPMSSLQLSDSLVYDEKQVETEEATEAKVTIELAAKKRMKTIAAQIINQIKNGTIPPVKFHTEVREGVPEEVINQRAKELKPVLIVMGTRGTDSKERDMVGSVTAEVLDTCRFPIFTVPESVHIDSITDIRRLMIFSNFDQEDILALDALYRLFPDRPLSVTLVGVPSKKQSTDLESQRRLLAYCREHYPAYEFNYDSITLKTMEHDFSRIIGQYQIDLIAVPNKKKNAFVRLFNPGIAHRLLFHADIPMMVIPV